MASLSELGGAAAGYTREVYEGLRQWIDQKNFERMEKVAEEQFQQVDGDPKETFELASMLLGPFYDLVEDHVPFEDRNLGGVIRLATEKFKDSLPKVDLSHMSNSDWFGGLMGREDNSRFIGEDALRDIFRRAGKHYPGNEDLGTVGRVMKAIKVKE